MGNFMANLLISNRKKIEMWAVKNMFYCLFALLQNSQKI